VRPDPPGSGVLPLDRPQALPAPRRAYWQAEPDARIVWESASRFSAQRPAREEGGRFLASALIPVPAVRSLSLELTLAGTAVDLAVRVLDCGGAVIASETLALAAAMAPRILRLAVPTEATSAVAIELCHGPQAFAVSVDLGRTRRPAPIADPCPAVPEPARWEATTVGAVIRWSQRRQTIRWDGAASLYLAKSYSRPCLPGVTLRYPVRLCVRAGALGIGVLSEDFQSWVKTFRFETGEHATTLEIEVGSNARVQIVVYACERGRLDAEIDWTEAMQQHPISALELDRLAARARALAVERNGADPAGPSAPDKLARRAGRVAAKAMLAAAPAAGDATAKRPEPASRPPRGGSVWRLIHDPRTVHCHKPWTDLHNFTVDGRMDVCCIATGASQTRFALGNLSEQSFQEVWNGGAARKFRRTVNDPVQALPPCQRCPMAQSYAGPLFNPEHTALSVWRRVRRLPVPLAQTRPGRFLLLIGFLLLYGPVHLWMFRGFRRATLLPPFKTLWQWQ
jgi:radical SAM protein with 4Fe4S-binding SPASM domain